MCNSDHYHTVSEIFHEFLLTKGCLCFLACHSRLSVRWFSQPTYSTLSPPLFPSSGFQVISISLKLSRLDHYLIFSECSLCFPTVMFWLKVFSVCGTFLHCHSVFQCFLIYPKYCHPLQTLMFLLLLDGIFTALEFL